MNETDDQKKARELAEAESKARQEALDQSKAPRTPRRKPESNADGEVRYRILHTMVDDHRQNNVVTADHLGGEAALERLIELKAIEEVKA